MPTARELLDQADALMRRNRGREPEPDIPELTDEIAAMAMSQGARASARPTGSVRHEASEDVPELTDVVVDLEEVAMENDADDGDESLWLESQLGGASITGPAPDSIAVVPPSTLRAAPSPQAESVAPALLRDRSDDHQPDPDSAAAVLASALAARLAAAPDSSLDAATGLLPETALERELDRAEADVSSAVESVVAPDAAPVEPTEKEPIEAPVEVMADDPIDASADLPIADLPVPAAVPSWEAVAEEIRMQVLQRIDIFTDTGLQGELAARLQPVVDRASADLIATINREVGQLLRTYVAEAIEREITKWRESNP